jgi:hypothetical protein
MVATILSEGIVYVQECRVSNTWSYTSSLAYSFIVCTGATKRFIYQTVETLS